MRTYSIMNSCSAHQSHCSPQSTAPPGGLLPHNSTVNPFQPSTERQLANNPSSSTINLDHGSTHRCRGPPFISRNGRV